MILNWTEIWQIHRVEFHPFYFQIELDVCVSVFWIEEQEAITKSTYIKRRNRGVENPIHTIPGVTIPQLKHPRTPPPTPCSFRFNPYRMCMTHSCDVLTRRPILHCKSSLVDHFSSNWCDHMASQQSVSLLIAENLHQSVNLGVCSRSAVGWERKLANLIGHTLKSKRRERFLNLRQSWFTSIQNCDRVL